MPQVPRDKPMLPGIAEQVKISRIGPLWKGPLEDGVTSSLLSRYIADKERFRIHAIEGWAAQDHWNHRLEFGNLWHKAEEALASYIKNDDDPRSFGDYEIWEHSIIDYAQDLYAKYPLDRVDIEHYYNICKTTFPLYVDYWSKHPDVQNRTPLLQEQPFSVPYHLSSGRVVLLRGKMDSADLIDENGVTGLFLQENKTKSTIDGAKLERQLKFDLQTMLYLVALIDLQRDSKCGETDNPLPDNCLQYQVLGVRYNVIRRSMHKCTNKDGGYDNWGGLGNSGFNSRLAGLIQEKPKEWFQRWKVMVSVQDIEKFKNQCLHPVLENLLDDYEWWVWCKNTGSNVYNHTLRSDQSGPFGYQCPRHFRLPYGVYNPTLEGGDSDLDNYLDTGSTLGLRRIDNLFPELTEGK